MENTWNYILVLSSRFYFALPRGSLLGTSWNAGLSMTAWQRSCSPDKQEISPDQSDIVR